MGPKTWDPFKRALEASPFVTCRPTDAWTRTDHPVELKGETATRRYTFTHPDGRTTHCTLALATRGPSHYNPTHWWITHLNTPNTS